MCFDGNRRRLFHVKHQTTAEPPSVHEILEVARAVGVACSESQGAMLRRHAELVMQTNARCNLTAITDPGEFLVLHIADSLAFLPVVGSLREPVVDIGSGAGYPGVPVAVCAGADVVLCESRRKRADFLNEVAREIGCSVRVFAGRAEDLALQEPARAGTVIVRAVAAMPSLVELAAPLLVQGGRLIALKGDPPERELERADAAADLCGMGKRLVVGYALPGRSDRRAAVIYERIGEPTVRLPRRAGLAQAKPLGG